jgi:hypothetical protein
MGGTIGKNSPQDLWSVLMNVDALSVKRGSLYGQEGEESEWS